MSPRRAWALTAAAHAGVACWIFAGGLFGGRVLYFRDVSVYYYPNYVFAARALEQGVWPLWNHAADGGAPFLMVEPLELLALLALGAEWALRLLPPLYLAIGMCGVSVLARRLGRGRVASWAAGLLYGASGVVLSTANLFELFHATAWAPWAIAALLRLWEAPTWRRVALLAVSAALLASTLSAEMALQAGVVGLVLAAPRLDRPRLAAAAASGLLAALLAAPAWLGVQALLSGSARASGFPHEVSFAWSTPPIVWLELLLPRLFGDTHTWGELGYWGQPFFTTDLPYLLSLYMGPIAIGLALGAGRAGGRLWALAAVGVLLSMGDRGPVEMLMAPWMTSLRAPVKFAWMTTLALCLLAARGVDAHAGGRGRVLGGGLAAAGLALVLLGLWSGTNPAGPPAVFGGLVPELESARAAPVIRGQWPGAFGVAGTLAMAAGLAALRGGPLLVLVPLLAGLDMLIANETINPTAPASFYELRRDVSGLIAPARERGLYRWFSYGLAYSPGLQATPALGSRNADVWLYYLDRQALLPRSPVLDGLEGAFDMDRIGWSPAGSTLEEAEKDPRRYREHHRRLRLGGVRWVLSFDALPSDLVEERGRLPLEELSRPLRLYELRDPLPRAFWVPEAEVAPGAAVGAPRWQSFDPTRLALLEGAAAAPLRPGGEVGEVEYERVDPHTVRLRVRGDPGWIVVLDNYHPAWRAREGAEPVPLQRADGLYWALPTPGGDREWEVRFEPGWRPPALAASALAALLALGLGLAPAQRVWASSLDTPRAHR